jgi:hypothetical protein
MPQARYLYIYTHNSEELAARVIDSEWRMLLVVQALTA